MLYDKMVKTNETRDVDAFLSMIDEDFVMVSHQNQTERSKQEFAEMVRGMMSSDSLEVTDQRCVYENDDILVEHSFMSFPDGSKEAGATFDGVGVTEYLCSLFGAFTGRSAY